MTPPLPSPAADRPLAGPLRSDDGPSSSAGDGEGMESLEPLPRSERTWTWTHFARLWVCMQINPVSLVQAGGLLNLGLNLGEVLGATAIGCVIVTAALVANAGPGAEYGICFPVYAVRTSTRCGGAGRGLTTRETSAPPSGPWAPGTSPWCAAPSASCGWGRSPGWRRT